MIEEMGVEEIGLDYKDVYIIPQYSTVTSRSSVDVSGQIFRNIILDVPVISANMDTITEHEMARAMYHGGGAGALHRFMPIEENVNQYKLFLNPDQPEQDAVCLVSIGVNGDSEARAEALYAAGARYFIIDIAHGHSSHMKATIRRMKSKYGNVKDPILIMAGNIATMEAAEDLAEWGADALKVGIGPGAACLTKNVTGVTVPQLTAVYNVVSANTQLPIIADGGITEIGDIAKALGMGANAVMCGRLFAACQETPGPRLNGKKIYRGMASKGAMLKIKSSDNLPTAEGAELVIEDEPTNAVEVLQHIKGGLQSAFSYSNAKDMMEFCGNVKFGSRK